MYNNNNNNMHVRCKRYVTHNELRMYMQALVTIYNNNLSSTFCFE